MHTPRAVNWVCNAARSSTVPLKSPSACSGCSSAHIHGAGSYRKVEAGRQVMAAWKIKQSQHPGHVRLARSARINVESSAARQERD
jgi:positive regulator of sigma E activity